MEEIVRIVLLFMFIQFVVVMTVMSVAILLLRPEFSVFGEDPGYDALKRGVAFVVHLPSRARRSVTRLAHSIHG